MQHIFTNEFETESHYIEQGELELKSVAQVKFEVPEMTGLIHKTLFVYVFFDSLFVYQIFNKQGKLLLTICLYILRHQKANLGIIMVVSLLFSSN